MQVATTDRVDSADCAAQNTLRVLLVGHACCPGLGSEPGYTWNWAWELSKQHQVWLIAHPENKEQVEQFCRLNPNPNLHIHWVVLRGYDPWDPKRGQRGVRLHYVLWLRQAFRTAQQLHARLRFDVVHLVSLGTIATGAPFWRLSAPFVWGPVGGAQYTPPAFIQYFGSQQRVERLRKWRIELLRFVPGIRQTVAHSALMLATNYETYEWLRRCGGGDRVRMLNDAGLTPEFLAGTDGPRRRNREITLLWAGRVIKFKALPIALEGLAAAGDVPVRLRVAGDGPELAECEALAQRLGVASRVEFMGRVPFASMPDLYRSSDALIFTSLRDSTGSVVLEAMANGLPVITLNQSGAGYLVPDTAGFKIEVSTPAKTIQAIGDAIRRLAADRALLDRMSQSAVEFAKENLWETRAARVSEYYAELASAHRNL